MRQYNLLRQSKNVLFWSAQKVKLPWKAEEMFGGEMKWKK